MTVISLSHKRHILNEFPGLSVFIGQGDVDSEATTNLKTNSDLMLKLLPESEEMSTAVNELKEINNRTSAEDLKGVSSKIGEAFEKILSDLPYSEDPDEYEKILVFRNAVISAYNDVQNMIHAEIHARSSLYNTPIGSRVVPADFSYLTREYLKLTDTEYKLVVISYNVPEYDVYEELTIFPANTIDEAKAIYDSVSVELGMDHIREDVLDRPNTEVGIYKGLPYRIMSTRGIFVKSIA